MSDLQTVLYTSICGPLANKVKMAAIHARKNKKLGEQMSPTFSLLFEQLLPHYINKNEGNLEAINTLHNLVFLLAHKA